MYNKCRKIVLFSILLSAFSSLSAHNAMVEVRGSYFYPFASKTRDVYSGGALWNLQGSCGIWDQLYGWASVGYMETKGKTVAESTRTKLYYVPLAAGLEYMYNLQMFQFRLGGGVLVPYIQTKDYSNFVVQSREKWGVGAIFKTTAAYYFTYHFYGDIFFDFSWLDVSYHNTALTQGNKAHLSAMAVGAGLGYHF